MTKPFVTEKHSKEMKIPEVIEIKFSDGNDSDSQDTDPPEFEVSKNTGYIKTKPSEVLNKARKRREREDTKYPIVVWVLIAFELAFDLITGVIAILSTAGATTCCGHNLYLGPMVVKASIPFFFLIAVQVTFLIQVILTSMLQERRKSSTLQDDSCCGCLSKWNATTLLGYLNMMTIVNPFFGCLIAYILLYQSSKMESFLVLGIEALSIVIHLVAIRMVGGLRTCGSRALHSIVLIPFLFTIVHIVLFFTAGGVCYSVETRGFGFSGCEICPDTLEPPGPGGSCGEDFEGVFSRGIESILETEMDQGDYCSRGVNFCFFDF